MNDKPPATTPAKPVKKKSAKKKAKKTAASKPIRDKTDDVIAWLKETISERIYVGVDPGTTGAIGIIRPATGDVPYAYRVLNIPQIRVARRLDKTAQKALKAKSSKGSKAVPKLIEIHRLFDALYYAVRDPKDVVVCVEQVLPRYKDRPRNIYAAAASTWLFPLGVVMMGFTFYFPPPTQWKGHAGLSGGEEGKALSRSIASKVFDRYDFSSDASHNRAEALLLGNFSMTEAASKYAYPLL